MTDSDQTGPASTDAAPPTPMPGEQRRLARPPSDRYLEAEAKAAEEAASRAEPSVSVAKGLAIALIAALIGALALVLLGAIATVTTGLIVVAGATGFAVGVALQLGAGMQLSRGRRIVLAVVLTVAAIGLGQIGIWQYGRAEGGVLPLVEYLAEVFGPLVIVEFVVGAVVAWVAAR